MAQAKMGGALVAQTQACYAEETQMFMAQTECCVEETKCCVVPVRNVACGVADEMLCDVGTKHTNFLVL